MLNSVQQEEQILLKDIFKVTTQLQMASSDLIFLKDFAKDLKQQGEQFSLLQNETLFDSMLMERSAIPNTNLLQYYSQCYYRACDIKDKPWNINNQSNQNFIKYSQQILINFAFLSITAPDIFPEQWQCSTWKNYKEEISLISAKILTMFEQCGFNQDFFNELDQKIQKEYPNDVVIEALLNQIIYNQRHCDILDEKCVTNLQTLLGLFQIENYKKKFMNLQKYPFIPGQQNKNIKNDLELDQVKGFDLELRSALGPFFRISTLNALEEIPQDRERNQKMSNKIFQEFNNIKYMNQYKQASIYYKEQYSQYNKLLVELVKQLLKKTPQYNYQQDMLRYVAACIIGNKDRAKLGNRLQQQNKNLKKTASSDAFVLNMFDVMLEIAKIIFNKQEDKWLKVLPEYFQNSSRLKHLQEQPLFDEKQQQLNDKKGNKMEIENQEFGTITEFFFLCQQLGHFGLIPIYDSFKDNAEQLQRLEKQFKRMDPNNFQYKFAQQMLNNLKAQYFQYEVCLQIDNRINQVIQMYDLLLFMLQKWLSLDITKVENNEIKDYKPSHLVTSLPENMILDPFDFHIFYVQFRDKYSKTFLSESHILELLNIIILFLSNCKITTNKYLASKLVENLYHFYNTDKERMHKIITCSVYAQRNIIPALVKFYIDIEFSNDNMFYQKFHYRHYVNQLFSRLWEEKIYQEEIFKIIQNNFDLFERFINMVLNDCTYCTDEGISNLKILYEYNKKGGPQSLSQEEQQNYERSSNMANIFNQQSKETINLIANMSNWTPKSFLSDTFLELIVTMLNNFLLKIMDPTLNQYTQKDYQFSPHTMLRDLIIIYSNLSFADIFIKKIIDSRAYDLELFDRAIKKAKKDQLTPYDIQEIFTQFLKKLNQFNQSDAKSGQEDDIDDAQLEDAFQGEIPDEYLCALTFGLLQDPVQLPSSKLFVERAIIKKALLDNEIDPFNRQKLKREQLVEVPELKKKIDQWREEKKQILREKGKKALIENKINNIKKDDNEDSLQQNIFGNLQQQ